MADGVKIAGELRFIAKNGELGNGASAEEILRSDAQFPPCYDLRQGRRAPSNARAFAARLRRMLKEPIAVER